MCSTTYCPSNLNQSSSVISSPPAPCGSKPTCCASSISASLRIFSRKAIVQYLLIKAMLHPSKIAALLIHGGITARSAQHFIIGSQKLTTRDKPPSR